jgi:hypothetical protein
MDLACPQRPVGALEHKRDRFQYARRPGQGGAGSARSRFCLLQEQAVKLV